MPSQQKGGPLLLALQSTIFWSTYRVPEQMYSGTVLKVGTYELRYSRASDCSCGGLNVGDEVPCARALRGVCLCPVLPTCSAIASAFANLPCPDKYWCSFEHAVSEAGLCSITLPIRQATFEVQGSQAGGGTSASRGRCCRSFRGTLPYNAWRTRGCRAGYLND